MALGLLMLVIAYMMLKHGTPYREVKPQACRPSEGPVSDSGLDDIQLWQTERRQQSNA